LEFTKVIINVHHFADMVVEYLKKDDNFGMHIEISREQFAAGHGRWIKEGRMVFRKLFGERRSVFSHNVDVISTIDSRRMVQFHKSFKRVATLAVQDVRHRGTCVR